MSHDVPNMFGVKQPEAPESRVKAILPDVWSRERNRTAAYFVQVG
jgi:hypothetical protein